MPIASPEYNHSLSATLKNALDWASRKSSGAAIRGKPVAVLSQSPGPAGGVRMQVHLREVLSTVGARTVDAEFAAGRAMTLFDGGELSDPKTRELLGHHLERLVALAQEDRS